MQPIRPVPFATAGSEDLPTSVIDGDDKPLVYFTLGTVFNNDVPFFLTVVDGLAALPVRVLVTVGPKGDPGSLGTMPANVHVARYVPQTQILPTLTSSCPTQARARSLPLWATASLSYAFPKEPISSRTLQPPNDVGSASVSVPGWSRRKR